MHDRLAGPGLVVNFSGTTIFAMSLAKTVGLYVLAGVLSREARQYLDKVRSGRIRATT